MIRWRRLRRSRRKDEDEESFDEGKYGFGGVEGGVDEDGDEEYEEDERNDVNRVIKMN
jgi:hypothetical protein